MIRRFVYAGVIALAMTACQFQNIDEVLLTRSDISLTVKGELQMAFDENTCQLGYNTARNEFRVYDESLTNWFILKCAETLTSEGQEFKADLEYKTNGESKTLNGLTFTVKSSNVDGLIWLWNRDKQIGIVVKSL